ncbi:GNAT family N-acetyltransferase [Amycolatopsis sp. SID8362]|uniref:GNAT family N-acetyltransferase n=1 Tax=Amycolatopsis sp. SID8362 TaxID=2690346 RepID=UPI0013704C6E|nr:GNAT family N-acetyltransferase [Amycolatopsis sp. SID8362]NBH06930.1 GNAT family N-acetyltransferase [Amycolatopsis sp. SID8362]NED43627.1 GNAT family N-acetyltransferase [Amycolatopsis sp. SID8362]
MVEIVRATPDQAAALTALVLASSAYRGDYATILDGYEVTPAYVAANPTFTATDDGAILGFYALVAAELDLLFVADAAQGLGVGRRLVEHLRNEARARGLRDIRVVAHPPALEFYLRMGARRTGTVPPNPPKARWERPELRFDVPTC